MAIKMYEGKGDLSGFNAQRSPFDAKGSPFDMKASNLTDMRAEIGGRTVYSPMLGSFDKRVDAPQSGLFSGTSPMSGALGTAYTASAAGDKASSFDSRQAKGFDRNLTVPDYRGREVDLIQNPKPFSEGMAGGDPMTAQHIRDGGKFGATISLEEVRDLINKDVKGASLQIPQPAVPEAKP